jgi:hypothetical protein
MSYSAIAPKWNAAALTFLILTGGACGMAALLALLPAAGHDQMWLLYAARLMLHGSPIYGPEIFETNPPLILWMSTVPAAIGSLTHLPDTAVGKLLALAVEFGIGALCLRLLGLTRPALSRATLCFFAFVYVTVVAVMPARDFGQRDHFLVLFLLPYVFAAAGRAEGIRIAPALAALVGALALCGVVLKPHHILVFAAIEISLLFHKRAKLLRPELLAAVVSGLLFLLAVRLFAPRYLAVIVPLDRDTYWAYGAQPFLQLLRDSIQLHLLAALDLALILFAGSRKTTALSRMLFTAGIAATLAFHLQGTGWYYQQLPALTFLSFALAFLLLDRAEPLKLPAWSPKAAAALTLIALALTTHFMDDPFTAERSFPVDTPAPSLFAGIAPGTPVMTISVTVDDTIQPIYKYHLVLAGRGPALVLLPAILRAEDPADPASRRLPPGRLAELDRLQHQFMVEDLNRWHPQLILVERCQDPAVHCQVLENRHDNLLAWFERDPAFAAIFAHYRLIRSAGAYDAYTLNGSGPREQAPANLTSEP